MFKINCLAQIYTVMYYGLVFHNILEENDLTASPLNGNLLLDHLW